MLPYEGLYDRDFTEKKSLVRESDGPSLDGPEAEVTTWKTEPVEELEGYDYKRYIIELNALTYF